MTEREASVFCPNCGSEYAAWSLKCPYCGSTNAQGAERVYMQHMEELRQRLDVVDEESDALYRKNVTKSVRKILCIALLVLAALAFLVSLIRLASRRFDRVSETRARSEIEWQKDVFPELDALYEAGEYDKILDAEDASSYGLYDWPHYYFVCEYYEDYRCIKEALAMKKEGTLDSFYLGEAIYGLMMLRYEATDKRLEQLRRSYDMNGENGITAAEADRIRGYRDETAADMKELLGWSEEEGRAFYEKCTHGGEYGYPSLGTCFDEADKILKRGK